MAVVDGDVPLRTIPKAELKKVKRRVAALRRLGYEVTTDEEIERGGWTLDGGTAPTAPQRCPSMEQGMCSLVSNERQMDSWDCGIACVHMICNALSAGERQSRYVDIDELKKGLACTSVWTIDLAYLLAEHGVACEYLTRSPTLDESSYSTEAAAGFYADTIETDSARVKRLLAAAGDEGIQVTQRTLSSAEMWNLLREEETLVIALVDARVLYGRPRAEIRPKAPARQGGSMPPRRSKSYPARLSEAAEADEADEREAAAARSSADGSFVGHFVVVAGLDDERGGYLINDPSRDDEKVFVKTEAFEAARRAEGTDEDLLLIPLYQSEPPTRVRRSNAEHEPMIHRVLNNEGVFDEEGEAADEGRRLVPSIVPSTPASSEVCLR